MSHDWAPPAEQDRLSGKTDHADLYQHRFDAGADEVAPVDRQADPAHWLPGKALIITAVIVGAALLATIVICLIIWLTPPMHHLQVPVVPKG